jgi:hypothetical protein
LADPASTTPAGAAAPDDYVTQLYSARDAITLPLKEFDLLGYLMPNSCGG